MTKSLLALAGALCLLAPSAASAAATRTCGDQKPHGITKIKATSVSCASAVTVARRYNTASAGGSNGAWRCKGRRVSSKREAVTCRKGSRRVTFRSTYVVELPPAEAPPSTNG